MEGARGTGSRFRVRVPRLIGVWRRARPCRRRDALGRRGRCDVPSKSCSPRVHHAPFEPDVSWL
jgi:hypothetical protein